MLVGAQNPSREEARAALAEAKRRASQVHRSDLQLCWMLLAIWMALAAVSAVMSFAPHRGTAWAPPAIGVMLIGFLAAAVVIALRMRAYSRGAIGLYFASVIAFNLWNAVVVSTSIATQYWASGRPTSHFGVSGMVGSIPLLVGAWLIGRRSSGER